MGKTHRPLNIVVWGDQSQWAEWESLRQQGHQVMTFLPTTVDLIFAPGARIMTDKHRSLLKGIIERAQKVKYPKVKEPKESQE